MATVAKRQKVEEEEERPSTSRGSKKKSKKNTESNAASADWDVDDYRTEYESEEHWELRRNFMLAHKDRFDEERLVCLAQTFVNMEFMGCKYPSETMLLVAEMSKDIAEEFRQKRAQRLKRTFVSASDAAEQRAKGRAAAKRSQPLQDRQTQSSRSSDKRACFDCLRNSCNVAHINYVERKETEPNRVEIVVNDEIIASTNVPDKKSAREARLTALNTALNYLKMHCYCIKLNPSRETIKVEKSKSSIKIDVTKDSAEKLAELKSSQNNKGYRIMRLMGWTGGGLGRNKQGRDKPVGYLLKNNRTGLGSTDPLADLTAYKEIIENYANSDDIRELQFEPTFSKEERATFHQLAGRFGLHTASYGKGESRRLLITKKIPYKSILEEVLIRGNPKFRDRYLVQAPVQKAHLFSGLATADMETTITE